MKIIQNEIDIKLRETMDKPEMKTIFTKEFQKEILDKWTALESRKKMFKMLKEPIMTLIKHSGYTIDKTAGRKNSLGYNLNSCPDAAIVFSIHGELHGLIYIDVTERMDFFKIL